MTPQELLLQLRGYETTDTSALAERRQQREETMAQLAAMEAGRQANMEKQRIINEREAKRRKNRNV